MRVADSLNEVSGQTGSVSLYRIKQRERCRVSRDRADIVHAAVVDCKSCGRGNVVEIYSELGVVPSDGPRKIICELVTLLRALDVGVRFPPEIGKTWNIDRGDGSAWDRCVVEVG